MGGLIAFLQNFLDLTKMCQKAFKIITNTIFGDSPITSIFSVWRGS